MSSIRKIAWLVAGVESSGTRMLAASVVSTGIFGDSTHEQRLDNLSLKLFETEDKIVIRRSVPYGAGEHNKLPDLKQLKELLEHHEYQVRPLVITRDRKFNAWSLVANGHCPNLQQANERIDIARKHIDLSLLSYLEISYEQFVLSEQYRKDCFANIGLSSPIIEYKDENKKYLA